MLNLAIEIQLTEYINLKNPIFKSQTRVDDNNMYWVVVENDGILYKIHCFC